MNLFNEDEVEIKRGRSLRIITEEDYVKLPSFTGIGLKFQTIIFLKLSKAARELLLVLIKERNIDTNEAAFITKEASAKSKASRAYRELNRYDIAVRVKKQTYLLNPSVIIPRKECFDKVKEEWLKHGK